MNFAETPGGSGNCRWLYGIFSHATSCTRYWQCWNGTSTVQQCPFSLLFNDDLHSCDWPDNVADCQKHPICKDLPNGRITIANACVRYWLCVGGYPRLQRCAAGLAFNPTALRCELAEHVPGCEPPSTIAPQDDRDRDDDRGDSRDNRPPPPRQNPRPQQGARQIRPQPQPVNVENENPRPQQQGARLIRPQPQPVNIEDDQSLNDDQPVQAPPRRQNTRPVQRG